MDLDPEPQTHDENLWISPIATAIQTNVEISIDLRVVERITLRCRYEIGKDAVDVQREENNLYLCPLWPRVMIKPG